VFWVLAPGQVVTAKLVAMNVNAKRELTLLGETSIGDNRYGPMTLWLHEKVDSVNWVDGLDQNPGPVPG
jgi:hypothetical protein